MNIYKIINNHLAENNHAVRFEDFKNQLRLETKSGSIKRSFFKNNIEEEYGTINNLFDELKKRGFENVNIIFQKAYKYGGTNVIFKKMKQTNINLKADKPQEFTSGLNATQSLPSFLGNPQQMLGAMINSERANDYKNQNEELKEEIKDYRTRVRKLEEENHALKLKVETTKEKEELKYERKLLEKKSVFESKGFEKVAESLGGIMPHLIPALINKGATPTQLAGVEMSLIKTKVVDKIKDMDDNSVAFIFYVLNNFSNNLVEQVKKIIENGKN